MTTLGVLLYGNLGQSFALPQNDWQQVLAEAQRNGWRPAGTHAPPRPLGSRNTPLTWSGSYGQPCGQTILPHDVEQISQALAAVSESKAEIAAIRSFLEECGRGGLLICDAASPEVRMNCDLQALASALTSAGRGAVPASSSADVARADADAASPVRR